MTNFRLIASNILKRLAYTFWEYWGRISGVLTFTFVYCEPLPFGSRSLRYKPVVSSLPNFAAKHTGKAAVGAQADLAEHARSFEKDSFKAQSNVVEMARLDETVSFDDSLELVDRTPSVTGEQDIKLLIAQGFELRNAGNYRGAIKRFDRAIAQDENYAKPFLYRGQTFIQMREYDAALNDFRKVLQLDPTNVRAWHGQGVAKAELRLYPSAVDSFDQAIACEPNNDKIWYNRGRALLKLQQYEPALSSFDRAIALNKFRYHAWYSRALAQAALEFVQPAIESLEQATALKASCHYAWNYRGTLLNRLFKHSEALESFRTSLKYRTPNPNAWYGLASTYALLNDPESSSEHLRKAVQLNPSIYSLMARNDVNFDLVRDHPKVRPILCSSDETLSRRSS